VIVTSSNYNIEKKSLPLRESLYDTRSILGEFIEEIY